MYNELQCGSYAFMDADYGRILDKDGNRIDDGEWENALFILTSRHEPRESRQGDLRRGSEGAVGRQRPAGDLSGATMWNTSSAPTSMASLPIRRARSRSTKSCKLVPGHCDPTCNVHDWYVGVRGGKVETLWPVTARGLAY